MRLFALLLLLPVMSYAHDECPQDVINWLEKLRVDAAEIEATLEKNCLPQPPQQPPALAEEIAYASAAYGGSPHNMTGDWVDKQNAFDGSLETYAYTNAGEGNLFKHDLEGVGHTIEADFRSIVNIWGRVYQECIDCEGVHEFETGEFGWWMPPNPFDGWSEEIHIPEILTGWDSPYHHIWDNHHTTSAEPLELRVYKTEYRVEHYPGLRGTLYDFDESSATDEQGVWSREANINIHPFGFALLENDQNGSGDHNALALRGTAAPIAGGEIQEVYLRFSGRQADYDGLHCEIWTAGKSQLLHVESLTTEKFDRYPNFGPWARIQPPSAGWSWELVQTLEAYIYGTGYKPGKNPAQVNYVQIKVFTPATD